MKHEPCTRCQQCAFCLNDFAGYRCIALERFEKGTVSCKFFKTPDELLASQQKAYKRLMDKGYYYLIDQYKLRPPVKYSNLITEKMEV